MVLSPWVDLDIAKELKRRFNTPFFHYPAVPIGPTETSRFLRELADYVSLDRKVVEDYIKRQEDRYYYYINRSLGWIYHCRPLIKKYVIVSSASAALSTTRFLINDLGFIPEKIYIVEDVPKEYQEKIKEYFQNVEFEHTIDVFFTGDPGIAFSELKNRKSPEKFVLLGSSWDDALAQNLKIPFIPISAPYGDVIIGNKNYFGYTGGISLFADYYTAVANKSGFGVTV
nr:nitrogenase component 1 [Clostridium pasteurianum]